MAQETSNPKGIVIVAVVLSAVGIVLFQQLVASYYDATLSAEQYDKLLGLPAAQLDELHKGEAQRLTTASLPIDRAVKELSTRGREDPSLKDVSKTDITPQPSNDSAAITGWALLATTAAPATATDPTAPATTAAAADAGAPAAITDAGAPPVRPVRPAPRGGRR
jgi:hypothetical protein